MTDQNQKMQELCGVWEKTTRDDLAYLSGRVKETITIPEGSYVNVFENRYKKPGENKPDFRIMVSLPADGGDRKQRANDGSGFLTRNRRTDAYGGGDEEPRPQPKKPVFHDDYRPDAPADGADDADEIPF